MAFMTLKTIVFQNEKNFNCAILFLLLSVCYLLSLIKGIDDIFFQGKVTKEIGVTKSNVFKEFVMTLLASTRVFHKKVN